MSRSYVRLAAGLSIAAVLGLAFSGRASAQELLTNPGFETGTFAGWTQSGNTGFTSIVTSPVHSGTFAASFGPVGSLGFISQTLTTTPGAAYNISWFLANGSSGTPNEFTVLAGGNTLVDMVNLAAQP